MSGRSTGFNIRRLISQRRSRIGEEAGDLDSDESTLKRQANNKEGRTDSWFTARRPNNRKRPPTPIIISRPQNVHNSLLYDTPRSSASSLCSCERFPGLRPSPLCSISSKRSVSSKDDRSENSLQLSSATSYGPDDLSPQFPIKDHVKSPMFVRTTVEPSPPKVDVVEPLSPGVHDKGARTSRQDHDKDSSTKLPDNIQRLIDETDEAFKAVGSALVESQLTRRSFNETPKLPPLETQQPPLPNPKQSSLRNPPPFITSPLLLRRNPSLGRKKSKGSKMKPPRKPVKPLPKRNSRWAIGENVSEMFSGKLFNRIEADEMLTPAQLEAYRLKRMSNLKLQAHMNSTETLETFDTESIDTPIEPFHMDDLPLRIGSSGVKLTAGTPVDDEKREPTAPSFDEDPVKRDFSYGGKVDELFLSTNNAGQPLSSIQEDPMAYKNLTFPTPPTKRSISRKQLPALPSIPEATVASGPTQIQDLDHNADELFLNSSWRGRQNSVADDKYIFLRSPPCSMTVPVFRHGPIRLAKSDIIPDPKLGADEGLDWTAFQMAILGGAGDWFSDSQDTVQRQEAEDLEDLLDWWEGWHFEGAGGLITREIELSSPTSMTMSADYSDQFSYADVEHDNPYSAHHKWQHLPQKAEQEGRSLDLNLNNVQQQQKYYNEGGIKTWTASSGQLNVPTAFVNRESLLSMPQSPMLDLQIVKSDNGDVDYVPMGYNLSHDLGDFLTWEAEHVYSDHVLYHGDVV